MCTSNPEAHFLNTFQPCSEFSPCPQKQHLNRPHFWHWGTPRPVYPNCRCCKIWLKSPSGFEQACTKNCTSKPTNICSTNRSNYSWKLSGSNKTSGHPNFRAPPPPPPPTTKQTKKETLSANIPAHLLDNLFTGSECDLDGAVNDRVEEVLDGALHGWSDQGDQHGVGLQEWVLPTQSTTRPHNTSNTPSPAVAWTAKWGLSARILASNHSASHPQKSAPPPPTPVCITRISRGYTWFWHYNIFKYQMHSMSRCISAMLHAILRSLFLNK